jgi:hypothetical protein
MELSVDLVSMFLLRDQIPYFLTLKSICHNFFLIILAPITLNFTIKTLISGFVYVYNDFTGSSILFFLIQLWRLAGVEW